MTKIAINGIVRDMTAEEILAYENDIGRTENKAIMEKHKDVQTKRKTAITKLIALGLTSDECKALFNITKAKE